MTQTNDHPSERSNRAATARGLRGRRTLYPDERLVALLARRFAADGGGGGEGRRALDVGFGAGRHLRLLLDLGFETHGIEYTPEALEAARESLDPDTLARVASLSLADYRRFRPPAPFDVVVAWGVLPHSEYGDLAADLGSLGALLADGGRLFVNFRTRDNWFHGLGEPLGEHSWLLDARAREYEGLVYSFVSGLDDVRALVARSGLELVAAERLELWKANATERNGWILCELAAPSP